MTEQPLSYEQARARLVEVVQALESGSVPLSTSMELWQEAEVLARTCQEWLDGARARIEATRAKPEDSAAESGTV
ncbi:MAG TPA: exodeoxyribonuclease VII small subunit [Micropruina sp.]|jgi:exodeoxyribonuclease VII small subunit|nr:exodeoxyribonuclease VII small subunit [Micropruina sp.]